MPTIGHRSRMDATSRAAVFRFRRWCLSQRTCVTPVTFICGIATFELG
jgi:hypothetical protein